MAVQQHVTQKQSFEGGNLKKICHFEHLGVDAG